MKNHDTPQQEASTMLAKLEQLKGGMIRNGVIPHHLYVGEGAAERIRKEFGSLPGEILGMVVHAHNIQPPETIFCTTEPLKRVT